MYADEMREKEDFGQQERDETHVFFVFMILFPHDSVIPSSIFDAPSPGRRWKKTKE